MKHSYIILFAALLMAACTPPYNRPIYILYDNDVHGSVEGYEKMAALRADYLKKSIYVNVVSCGDFAQGGKVGSISDGKYPVAIMNAVSYDYVTLGNHEFDYGIPQLKKLMWWLHAKCLCCNLTYLPTGKDLFPAYDVRSYGNVDVAFIGVTTPTTIANSIPTEFMNKEGQVVYEFYMNNVVERVQQAVNAARQDGADYVIVLSHLGDDTKEISSVDLVHQTKGIDAVLDGHAHHVINTRLTNLCGDSVILASTGSNFRNVGCLLINDGQPLVNTLIDLSQYEGRHERVRSRIESIRRKVENKTSQYIGYSQVTLTDQDDFGQRLVRQRETNLGDFASDAMRVISQSDIGVCNGGGLRASLPQGIITFGDLLQVFPFNNALYKIELSGQQLQQALEIAVSDLVPESGNFIQVSGLRFEADTAGYIDSMGVLRRVVSAQVYRNDQWQPIYPDSLYTIGGQNYLLVCGGASGMFNGTRSLSIDHIKDTEVLSRYIHLLGDTIRASQYDSVQHRIQFVQSTTNQLTK